MDAVYKTSCGRRVESGWRSWLNRVLVWRNVFASLAAAGVRQYRVNEAGMFHSNAQGIRHTRKVQMPREATQQQQSP